MCTRVCVCLGRGEIGERKQTRSLALSLSHRGLVRDFDWLMIEQEEAGHSAEAFVYMTLIVIFFGANYSTDNTQKTMAMAYCQWNG